MSFLQLNLVMGLIACAFAVTMRSLYRQLRPAPVSTPGARRDWRRAAQDLAARLLSKPPAEETVAQRVRQISPMQVARMEQTRSALRQTDTYYDEIEHRLEQAFGLYERGRTSLATFKLTLASIEGEVQERLVGLSYRGDGAGVPGETSQAYLHASWALDAVEWCRNWAIAQEDVESGLAGQDRSRPGRHEWTANREVAEVALDEDPGEPVLATAGSDPGRDCTSQQAVDPTIRDDLPR